MATKTKSAPTPTPLVAEGLAIRAEIEIRTAARDLAAAALAEETAKLNALNAQLVALGAGRYCTEADAGLTCLVVAETPATLQADTFTLRSAEDEATARALTGDLFLKHFDRNVYFTPKDGFAAIAGALLTPAKARDLTALCLVPGQLAGGRVAHVRWK